MSAEPQNNDQPPKAVSVAQWKKRMGLGVPPLGSVVSCANCMTQVEVTAESWMLPRLAHSDAVVVCDACAGPHLPPAAAPVLDVKTADPWASAETVEPNEPEALVAAGAVPLAGNASQGMGTEVTLQGMVELDADMQAQLSIDTAKDVSRILQRLQQVLVAAEFLKTTPDGQPPVLLTDALDFITGRSDHCVIVLQQRELERPAAADSPPSAGSGYDQVEDKPS